MTGRGRRSTEDYLDTSSGFVSADFADPHPADLHSQISQIRDTFPSISKEHAAIVLHSFDYNVEKALCCIAQDGIQNVLACWSTQGKNGKVDFTTQRSKRRRRTSKKLKLNSEVDQNHPSTDENIETTCGPTPRDCDHKAEDNSGSLNSLENDGSTRNEMTDALKNDQTEVTKAKQSSTVTSPECESTQRAPTGSSEAVANDKKADDVKKKASVKDAMPRSVKDLQRSASAIARFHLVAQENFEAAEKTLKEYFKKIRDCVAETERTLAEKLDMEKTQAANLLNERQEYAASLRVRCYRITAMREDEVAELRAEIKRFVGDRKIDEKVAETSRFSAECDQLIKMIETFGTIIPVDAHYQPKAVPSEAQRHTAPSSPSPQSTVVSENSARKSFLNDKRSDTAQMRQSVVLKEQSLQIEDRSSNQSEFCRPSSEETAPKSQGCQDSTDLQNGLNQTDADENANTCDLRQPRFKSSHDRVGTQANRKRWSENKEDESKSIRRNRNNRRLPGTADKGKTNHDQTIGSVARSNWRHPGKGSGTNKPPSTALGGGGGSDVMKNASEMIKSDFKEEEWKKGRDLENVPRSVTKSPTEGREKKAQSVVQELPSSDLKDGETKKLIWADEVPELKPIVEETRHVVRAPGQNQNQGKYRYSQRPYNKDGSHQGARTSDGRNGQRERAARRKNEPVVESRQPMHGSGAKFAIRKDRTELENGVRSLSGRGNGKRNAEKILERTPADVNGNGSPSPNAGLADEMRKKKNYANSKDDQIRRHKAQVNKDVNDNF